VHSRWAVIIILTTVLSAAAGQYISPPQNYHHWRKLEKICETGRKTYGANEFLERGQVCRWTFVPYWPADRAAWDAARAAERQAEK
jgi:hypothetical protein